MLVPPTRVPSDSMPGVEEDRSGAILQQRYRLIRKLGSGGMGHVYEGKHELLGKRLAVKCLNARYITDPRAVERFRREARAASQVGSEHIIDVTDMGNFQDGSPYLVMEYLDGCELAEVIERLGPMSVGRMVKIAMQVCDALSAVHAEGIVHRDLKPQNIFLTKRKTNPDFVKVLDFGISKVKQNIETSSAELTQTGTIIGTPHYMAPEQAHGAHLVDHRADIYALGVILYLAWSGQVPFNGNSLPELVLRIVTENPVELHKIRKDIPSKLSKIVMKALQKHPEERFQTAEELKQALAKFEHIVHAPTALDFGKLPSDPPIRAIVPRSTERKRASQSLIRATSMPMQRKAPKWPFALAGFALITAGIATTAYVSKIQQDDRAPGSDASLVVPIIPKELENKTRDHQIEATEEKPGATSSVILAVRATPPDAEIWLDGKRATNPVSIEREPSNEATSLVVKKKGYKTYQEQIIVNQNQSLTLALEKSSSTKKNRRRVVRRKAIPHTTTQPRSPQISTPTGSNHASKPKKSKRSIRTTF